MPMPRTNLNTSVDFASPPQAFLDALGATVGQSQVLTRPQDTERFRLGYRSGRSEAVVRPGTLLELWRTLELCVKAGRIVAKQLNKVNGAPVLIRAVDAVQRLPERCYARAAELQDADKHVPAYLSYSLSLGQRADPRRFIDHHVTFGILLDRGIAKPQPATPPLRLPAFAARRRSGPGRAA